LVNLKLLIDAIAIPFGLIATIVIISRNKRNIANILIGLTAFLGGVASATFSALKEIFYTIDLDMSLLFCKFSFLSMFSMTIPVLSFSIFFWKAKYKALPGLLHLFAPLPTIFLAIWLFIKKDSIYFIETTYGINNFLSTSIIIYCLVFICLTLIILTLALVYMANSAKSFPQLRHLMNIFTVVFIIGFGSSFFSLFLFQYIFRDIFQPYALFVILTTLSLTIIFSITLSQEEKTIWHGCPKLKANSNSDNSTLCLNTEDGVPIEIKLLDLGNIIERIQLDTEVLKTGSENCTNTVFSDDSDIVRCLTTHEPIKVLGENVTRQEMELARNMDIMEGNELCAECLHKLIAYRKEHKTKTDSEIKMLFLGARAEEFFGIA